MAAALLPVQAVGFLVFGFFEYFQLQSGRVVTGIVSATLLVAWGASLGVLAYFLLRGRAWSRGPVAALELIHLPTAWSFRGGETTWVMLLLGASSLVILVMLVLPATTRHLLGDTAGTADADETGSSA